MRKSARYSQLLRLGRIRPITNPRPPSKPPWHAGTTRPYPFMGFKSVAWGPPPSFQGMSEKCGYLFIYLLLICICFHNCSSACLKRRATATVSFRLVPDQNPKEIVDSLKEYIQKVFQWKGTCNTLKVECLEQADWWLGDLNNRFFKAAEVAIERAWGQKPQCIREGGTIPVTQWLEKVFFSLFFFGVPFISLSLTPHLFFLVSSFNPPRGLTRPQSTSHSAKIAMPHICQTSASGSRTW